MQELLRLMMEWRGSMSLARLNVSPRSAVCTGMNMTQEVRDWIWTNVPPNKVQKFLEGSTTAQDDPEPPDITGTVVEDWLLEQINGAPTIGHMPTGS